MLFKQYYLSNKYSEGLKFLHFPNHQKFLDKWDNNGLVIMKVRNYGFNFLNYNMYILHIYIEREIYNIV